MTVRFIPLMPMVVALVCIVGLAEITLADEAPAWQPYRAAPIVEVQQAVPVQQFVEPNFVVAPPDAITEAKLDQLCVDCGDDPFVAPGNPLPLVVDGAMVDPVLVPLANTQTWSWHVLPGDVIWHSYWAGTKEPRISGVAFEEFNDDVSLLDVSLGGRASLFRFGTAHNGRPEGWELQLEGASMLRLNLDENWDLEAVDFRFGVPIIYGREKSQWKFSYYHLSSHLGDEYIIRTMSTAERINFSRDTLVLGYSCFPRPAWRWYAEAGWAFYADEGTDPWEFQFGVDYAQPGPTGSRGTPFFAINGHLREEVNFGGNLVAQAGWLWRGQTDRIVRTGIHYFNGKSNQFEFYNQFEQQVGAGLWYEY
ncbi:MAG: DUF1207 domain-containing protein [Bythopirellula sp.]